MFRLEIQQRKNNLGDLKVIQRVKSNFNVKVISASYFPTIQFRFT